MKESLKRWLACAPKSSHSIRILGGVYLLYTSFCIFRDLPAEHRVLLFVGACLFALSGAFLLLSSLVALIYGFTADAVKAEEHQSDSLQDAEDHDEND